MLVRMYVVQRCGYKPLKHWCWHKTTAWVSWRETLRIGVGCRYIISSSFVCVVVCVAYGTNPHGKRRRTFPSQQQVVMVISRSKLIYVPGGMLNVLRGEQQLVVEVCWSSQSSRRRRRRVVDHTGPAHGTSSSSWCFVLRVYFWSLFVFLLYIFFANAKSRSDIILRKGIFSRA